MASELKARFAAVLAAGLFTAAAAPALAEPSLSDRETARSLMEDGDAKRDKGDFTGALKAYEGADAIMRVPTTGLEVARAQAALGLLLEARETLGRVERLPVKPNEPPPFTAARKAAAELSAGIAARIPTITVLVKNLEPGATREVVVDGDTIPPAAAEAPRKVNPGAHTVLVRSAGVEKKEEIKLAEREQKTVTLDMKPAPPPPPGPPETTARGSSPLPKILIFGGFSLALAGAGVGTWTGLSSMSKVSDIEPSCNPKCPPDKQRAIDDARSLGNVATVAFVVAGAGVAAGVVGIVLAGKQARPAAARLTPVVAPTWAGLSGSF